MILRYDTIHMIHTLYCIIYEHLQYTDTIRNFFHMIQYILYDTYSESYDTNNYVCCTGQEYPDPIGPKAQT